VSETKGTQKVNGRKSLKSRAGKRGDSVVARQEGKRDPGRLRKRSHKRSSKEADRKKRGRLNHPESVHPHTKKQNILPNGDLADSWCEKVDDRQQKKNAKPTSDSSSVRISHRETKREKGKSFSIQRVFCELPNEGRKKKGGRTVLFWFWLCGLKESN